MKTIKVLIIAICVLGIAVIALFFLYYKNASSASSYALPNNPSVGPTIVYFDMDSLENNFEYLKQIRDELKQTEQQKTRELANLREVNKNKLLQYQKLYQEKGDKITEEEVVKMNQDLARLENDYKIAEQTKAQELNEESLKKIQDVKKKIEDYLKEYNLGRNYAYILSTPSDNIYYTDPKLNITNDLIKGLNSKYSANK